MTLPDHIVDSHHHLWDLNACHYPWLMEQGVVRFFGDPAPIQKDYLPENLRTDFGQLPVTKSVHIQVGAAGDDAFKETEWLERQGEDTGLPNAIVAFCDLTSPDREIALERHARATRLRGVRQIVGRSAEEDRQTGTASLLDDPAFEQGLSTLAAQDLSFDLQLTPPQMQKAAQLLERVPDLSVALCHCGSPSDFTPSGLAEWTSGLSALAELPNVLCKVSGFGMFDHDWTTASIRPRVLSVIDIFGPGRVAFGSNFPVDKLYASYASTIGAYLDITSGFSARERDAMFALNAESFYKI